MARFSIQKRYNKERVFNVDTSKFDYYSLGEIYENDNKIYQVRGIYINTRSHFDDAPVIATNDKYVNLPAHLLNTCKEILNDAQAIKAINDGYVGFSIYKYEKERYNKTCYSINWVDITPEMFENNSDGNIEDFEME